LEVSFVNRRTTKASRTAERNDVQRAGAAATDFQFGKIAQYQAALRIARFAMCGSIPPIDDGGAVRTIMAIGSYATPWNVRLITSILLSIPGGQAHEVHGVTRLADRERGVVTMTGRFDWFLQQHRSPYEE
jgi:hypothetical protein